MKNLLTLIALLLVVGVQGAYTQKKNDSSNYNYKRAIEILEGNGNQDEALEWLDKQITETPKHSDALLVRARINYNKAQYDKALSDVNSALKAYKKGAEYSISLIHYWRAEVYKELGELDKAISDYSESYKYMVKEKGDEQSIVNVLECRAHIYYTQKNYAKADEDYHLMLKHNEASQDAMIGLARNMMEREEYDAALAMLDKCQKYNADYYETYHIRMQVYDRMGEANKAIDNALLYLEKTESYNVVYNIIDILKKNYDYALIRTLGYISSGKDDFMWYFLRSYIYEGQYNFTDAIKSYDEILKKFGEESTILLYRANCYDEIGDTRQAVEDMNRAIAKEADYPNFYYWRGIFNQRGGNYTEALADFTKAIELKPDNSDNWYIRGYCYDLIDDDDKAMQDYDKALMIAPDKFIINYRRGILYYEQGDREKANAEFEEVIKRDTVADSGTCRMYALHFLGRDAEAIEWMDKVIADDPDDKGRYYDQACLYARMGKAQESVAALRTAFEKGYRTFAHIEADDDLDSVRELPEFKALIEEYKAKPIRIEEEEVENTSSDLIVSTSEVQMRKMRSGVYEVPCTINDLPLKFIFDTGASTTTISSVEATFMLKNGYLKESDIRGKEYYSTATGEIHEGTVIRLREIKIGDAVLRNVDASVTHSQQAPLLLGQSVMERFGTITIDNTTSKLTIKQK